MSSLQQCFIDPLTLHQLYTEGSFFYSCQEIDFCLYILSLITPKFKDQVQVGLYRNEGIALGCVQSNPKANRKKTKQEVSHVFKPNGLKFKKVAMEANRKIVVVNNLKKKL